MKRSKKWMACLLAILMVFALIPATVFAQEQDGITVIGADGTERGHYTAISDAVTAALPGDTLVLNGSITIAQTVDIDKPLILDGNNFQVTSMLTGGNQDMFKVVSNGKLTLKDVTIDGQKINTNAYLIRVSGGELSILEGTKLTGSGFCAVFVTDGSCTMDGGAICGNTYAQNNSIGAAVTVNADGVFTMRKGKIANNTAPDSSNGSAGIMVNNGGTAYLNGGTVEQNRAYASPAVTVEGYLEINGTSIQGNTADGWAGAMAVYSRGTAVMNSGRIAGNNALDGNGGAIYVEGYEGRPASFVMNGGSIEGNAAAFDGGAIFGYVYVQGDGDLGMSSIAVNGGSITGNQDQATDSVIEGAIFIRPGVQLAFSGSPTITGTCGIEAVDYDTLEANPDFLPIRVTGNFAPSSPVTLEIWGDYLVGQKIVQYENGVAVELDHFIAPVQNYGYQKAQDGNFLYTEQKRKILFHDKIGSTYDELSCWEFVGDSIREPEDGLVAKTGYTLDGWYRDSKLTSAWNFDTDTVPREIGNLSLYAKWVAIPAEAPVLPTVQNVELSCQDNGETVLAPSFEEKEGYTYSYLWKNATGETVGSSKSLSVVSPENGKSTTYTLTVIATRTDNNQTAQANTTYTVLRRTHDLKRVAPVGATCTKDGNIEYWYCETCGSYFEDDTCTKEITREQTIQKATGHTPGTEWKSDEKSHWNLCSVCEEHQNSGTHTFAWIIDREASETETGLKHEQCTVCGYEKPAEQIPATGMGTTDPTNPEKPDIELPVQETDSGTGPQTGDNLDWIWMAALLLASTGGIAVLALFSRKRKTH